MSIILVCICCCSCLPDSFGFQRREKTRRDSEGPSKWPVWILWDSRTTALLRNWKKGKVARPQRIRAEGQNQWYIYPGPVRLPILLILPASYTSGGQNLVLNFTEPEPKRICFWEWWDKLSSHPPLTSLRYIFYSQEFFFSLLPS